MESIRKGDIEFIVENGVLIKMISMVNITIDAYIPKKPSDDVEINAIGKYFCQGRYGKIVVDNDIAKVNKRAFSYCFAKEVVWPNSCNVIPERCFQASIVGELSNIDHITTIEQGAFDTSAIKELDWPDKCEEIPEYCFNNGMLECISGIDNVKNICDSAFAFCNIEEITWPSKCGTIPCYCFQGSELKRISNIQNVKSIGKFAFANCHKLDCIDLTSLLTCDCDKDAFIESDETKILMPYYVYP